jgi:hypothetical protein
MITQKEHNEQFGAIKKRISRLANMPLFTRDTADAVAKGFQPGATTTDRERAVKLLNSAGQLGMDAMYGKMDDNAFAKLYGTKYVQGERLPDVPTGAGIITDLRNMYNEGNLDMEWMPFFQQGDLRGSEVGGIVTFDNLVEWGDYGQTDTIKTSEYATNAFETLKPQRRGGAVALNRRTLAINRDFPITLNNVITAMRWSSLEYKAEVAYIFINAAIVASNSAYGSTAFVTGDLPQTINNASVTLLARLNGTGRMVSANSVLHLYASMYHRAAIEAAFRASNGDDGENIKVQQPIIRHYSFNLAADLAISGNKAMLCWGGSKSVMGDFAGLNFETDTQIRQNGLIVVGQEDYNMAAEEEQVQVFNLS